MAEHDDANGEQARNQSRRGRPSGDDPTLNQRKTAARLCLLAMSGLVFFLVTIVIASIRQPPVQGAAKGWESESGVVWEIMAWLGENLGDWALSLGVLATLATLLIAAFTDLYKSNRLLPVLVSLLATAIVLAGMAYFMTTRWSEVTGAIVFAMSTQPCPPCPDCASLIDSPEARLECGLSLIGGFWKALLVWLATSLATCLGLKLPSVTRALEKLRGNAGGGDGS
ncbi:MAG: hypothetical protein KJZ64_06175 [Sphingomonadaceae bacterium]|nr:hypothetical protein [Sphingomonadaceae bacterium]